MTPPWHKRNTAPCGTPQCRGGLQYVAYWLGAILFVLAAGAEGQTLSARVVGITDGDTVTVLNASKTTEKIRLSGIDAPEKKQPFGEKAKQSLSTLVFGKDVRIEWSKRDRYGRIVGAVFVDSCESPPCPEALDAGLAQIRAGLAWHYKRYMTVARGSRGVREGGGGRESKQDRPLERA